MSTAAYQNPSSHLKETLNACPCPWCPCDPQWLSKQTDLTIHDLCNWPCFGLSQTGPGASDILAPMGTELEMETPPFLGLNGWSNIISKDIQTKLDLLWLWKLEARIFLDGKNVLFVTKNASAHIFSSRSIADILPINPQDSGTRVASVKSEVTNSRYCELLVDGDAQSIPRIHQAKAILQAKGWQVQTLIFAAPGLDTVKQFIDIDQAWWS